MNLNSCFPKMATYDYFLLTCIKEADVSIITYIQTSWIVALFCYLKTKILPLLTCQISRSESMLLRY